MCNVFLPYGTNLEKSGIKKHTAMKNVTRMWWNWFASNLIDIKVICRKLLLISQNCITLNICHVYFTCRVSHYVHISLSIGLMPITSQSVILPHFTMGLTHQIQIVSNLFISRSDIDKHPSRISELWVIY